MSRAYLNLGVPPEITPLAMLRVAIGRLHPDTLAVRSWRPARKRYYRDTGEDALLMTVDFARRPDYGRWLAARVESVALTTAD